MWKRWQQGVSFDVYGADALVEGKVQNDDTRMDALAVTKLCLRAALTIDNKFVVHLLILSGDSHLIIWSALSQVWLYSVGCK